MDNQTIDMVSVGDDVLTAAMALIWNNAPGGKATHYKIAKYKDRTSYFGANGETSGHMQEMVLDDTGKDTLILLWHEENGALPLPFPLELDGAAQFVVSWLKTIEYPDADGFDGTIKKGWRLFTESWGHVAGHRYAIVGVQPELALYGK